MGLVKTRRLAAMQKQQKAKAGMKPPKANDYLKTVTRNDKTYVRQHRHDGAD